MIDQAALAEIQQLSTIEKIELAGQIWDSISEDDLDIQLSEEDKTELDRRLERCLKHPEVTRTWEEVRADLDRRFG